MLLRRWGWRLWAVPLLTALTVLVLVAGGGPPSTPPGRAAAPVPSLRTASPHEQLKVDQPGANAVGDALPPDALPGGAEYTVQGSGSFHTVPGTGPPTGTGPLFTYTVDVEDGITGVDEQAFAATVQTVLADPRSWSGQPGAATLQRVDSGPVSWHVSLTSAMTVRALCGYELQIETSCWNPDTSRVALNVARWVRGDVAYIGDLGAYHVYMINHESGHALGHMHVLTCLANGYAPVMMQQTITLKAADGSTCQANSWPFPPGVVPGPDPVGPAAASVN